jgi:HEAT repeat protein
MRHQKAQKAQMSLRRGVKPSLNICAFCASLLLASFVTFAQDSRNLTPAQLEIQKQQQRLNSSDVEERRDALMRLGAMRLPAAARAALPAVQDSAAIIRATAARAILALGGEQSAAQLLPLLNDKDEFVRREAAYALGMTKSHRATSALGERLLKDKEDGVRAAAAVALGEIADEAAVIALVQSLTSNREKNVFVLRAAATALGRIKSRAGTAALISTLSNENLPSDVRRQAARSLGLIGDPTAAPALKTATWDTDPYLAQIAHDALKKIKPQTNAN